MEVREGSRQGPGKRGCVGCGGLRREKAGGVGARGALKREVPGGPGKVVYLWQPLKPSGFEKSKKQDWLHTGRLS